MDTTLASTGTEEKTWGGGNKPLKASYGKMMMWFCVSWYNLSFSFLFASSVYLVLLSPQAREAVIQGLLPAERLLCR